MANYRVELTRTAEKQLKRVPKSDVPRVVAALEMLALTPLPTGCRKLAGHQDLFRVRVGVSRILYELLEERVVVKVLKIGHRKDIYRSL